MNGARIFALLGMSLLSATAAAMWMQPDQTVPVERLIENLKQTIEKYPQEAQPYYELARVYSYAYAVAKEEFEVYTSRSDKEGWTMATYGAYLPPSSGNGKLPTERLNFLAEAVKYYRTAVEKKPEDMYFQIGLGYVCMEAARQAADLEWPFSGTPFDDEAKSRGKEAVFWEEKALEACRKAFTLDQKPDYGLAPPVALEAGQYILAILTKRPNPTGAEQKEIRRMKRAVSSMAQGPHMVTPIIFSPRNEPLKALLDPDKRVNFDLDGSGRHMRWTWLKPGTALLAWDPLRTGVISSGRHLFGTATWWMFWKNGYQALAALDDNGDGTLRKAELEGLAVWVDANANAVSDPGEVITVEAFGITGIGVRSSGSVGGTLFCREGIRFGDGVTVTTYDWVSEGAFK